MPEFDPNKPFDYEQTDGSAPSFDASKPYTEDSAPALDTSKPFAPERPPSTGDDSRLRRVMPPNIYAEAAKDVAGQGKDILLGTLLGKPTLVNAIGRAVNWAGNAVAGQANDLASLVSGDQKYFGENLVAGLTDQPQPYNTVVENEMTPTQRTFTKVGQSLAKMLPQMGMAKLATGATSLSLKGSALAPEAAEWLSHSIGSAAGFGATEEGYDPVQSLIAFSFPSVSGLGSKAALGIADKLGIEFGTQAAKKAIEQLGSFAAFQAFQDIPMVTDPEFRDPKTSNETKLERWAHSAIMNVGLHMAALPQLAAAGIKEVQIKKAANEVSQLLEELAQRRQAQKPTPTPQPEAEETPQTLAKLTEAPKPTRPSVQPTAEQAKSGNYPKEKVAVDGLTIAVENTPGSTRSGVGPDGKPWSVVMPATYGEIEGTKGADGDKVDAYLGTTPNDTVYVVDQKDPKTGKFDEHKSLINFASQQEAVETYNKAFSDGSGPARNGGITEMTKDQFKEWVKSKRAKEPLVQPQAEAPRTVTVSRNGLPVEVPKLPPPPTPKENGTKEDYFARKDAYVKTIDQALRQLYGSGNITAIQAALKGYVPEQTIKDFGLWEKTNGVPGSLNWQNIVGEIANALNPPSTSERISMLTSERNAWEERANRLEAQHPDASNRPYHIQQNIVSDRQLVAKRDAEIKKLQGTSAPAEDPYKNLRTALRDPSTGEMVVGNKGEDHYTIYSRLSEQGKAALGVSGKPTPKTKEANYDNRGWMTDSGKFVTLRDLKNAGGDIAKAVAAKEAEAPAATKAPEPATAAHAEVTKPAHTSEVEHTLDDIAAFAQGKGTVTLYHGTNLKTAKAVRKSGFSLQESGESAARKIAAIYGIPYVEFKEKITSDAGYGPETRQLSTGPFGVAVNWATGFKHGELLSNLNSSARMYVEAKRRGVSYDKLYEEAQAAAEKRGVRYTLESAPDLLGLEDKLGERSAPAVIEMRVNAKDVPAHIRKQAQMILKSDLSPEQKVLSWNRTYKDIKVDPKKAKVTRVLDETGKPVEAAEQISAPDPKTGPNIFDLIDFDGRALSEKVAGKDKTAFFEVKDPEEEGLEKRLVADASPSVKTLGQSGKNEGKNVAALSKNNTHRVTFFENQETGEVVGLPTWKNAKGEVMITREGYKRGVKYSEFTADGNNVPIASVRLSSPLYSADTGSVFRFEDARAFEDQVLKPAKERVAATARTAAASEEAMHDVATTSEGETIEFSGTHTDENMDREVHEAIAEFLPRDKSGKIQTKLTPAELQEAILTILEQPENKTLFHHVAYEALLELKREEAFNKLSPEDQQRELIKQITAKFYDQYKAGEFEKDYADTAGAKMAEAARNAAKGSIPSETTNVGDANRTGQDGRAAATGGSAVPAQSTEAAGERPVLRQEAPATSATDSVSFDAGDKSYTVHPQHETSPFNESFASPEVSGLKLSTLENARDVLAAIYPYLELPQFHRLAERLTNLVGHVEIQFVRRIDVNRGGGTRYARGVYNPRENKIYIALSAMGDIEGFAGTVMHELVHAATAYGIDHAPEGMDVEEFRLRQGALQFDLEHILAQARAVAEQRGLNYPGLANIHELVAEGMTDRQFQHFLGSVEVRGVEARPVNLLARMWNAITKFIGLKAKDSSALEHLVGAVEDAMDLTQSARFDSNKPDGYEILPSLARDKEEAEHLFINEEFLDKADRVNLARSVQNQNAWVTLPIFDTLPAGVLERLSFLRDRREALAASLEGHGEHRSTLSELMDSPLPMETKKWIAFDTLNNMLDAEMQFEKARGSSEQEIRDLVKSIRKTLSNPSETLNPQRFVERSVVKALTRAQAETLKMAVDKDLITARVDELEQLKKEGSIVLERAFRALAHHAADDRIHDPEVTTEELISTVPLNEQTLGLNVTPDMIQLARDVFSADKQLPSRLRALLTLDTDPAGKQELAQAMKELSDVFAGKTAGEDEEPISHLDWIDANPELARKLMFIVPGLESRIGNIKDWTKTIAAVDAVKQDMGWKQARESVYKMFGMEGFTHTYDGDSRITFTDPTTNEKVTLDVSLNGLVNQENAAKLQQLFANAEQYVMHPEYEGYDPKTAIAWRALLANKDFWLNSGWNPLAPRYVPTRLNLFGLLSDIFADPMKMMATLAGREANEVMVKHQAYTLAREQLRNVEHRLGHKVQKLAQAAAREHQLSLEVWRQRIANEVIASSQMAGQVPIKEGSNINGFVVTARDMEAVRAAKEYQDEVRKVAEDGMGASSVRVNPSRIKTEQGFRKAGPTSPYENTQPGRLDVIRADNWYQEWSRLKTNEERIHWLEQSDHMRDILMAHFRWQQTPGYVGTSGFRAAYLELAREYNTGERFSFNEIVEHVFNHQVGEEPLMEVEVAGRILGEVESLFRRVKARLDEVEREKAGDRLSVFNTTNSFTTPRNENSIYPPSFMQWGAVTYAERVGMTNDAVKFYANELIGKGGALERLQQAFRAKLGEYDRRIQLAVEEGRSAKSEKAAIEAEAKLGKEYYDYAQLKTAIRRVDTILKQENRLQNKNTAMSNPLVNAYRRVTNTMMGQILMSAGARLRHTFGNWQNWFMHMERLHGVTSAFARMPGHIVRNMVDVPTTMLAELGVFAGKDINEVRGIGSSFVKAVLERRAEVQRYRELGFADASNLRERMVAWREAMKNLKADHSGIVSFGQRLRAAGAASVDVFNQFVSQLPVNARFNDLVLNLEASNARIDLERMLQANALQFVEKRAQMNPATYTDLSKPENRLTPQELLGKEGATGRQAAELRALFAAQGIDIDRRMVDYYKRYTEAKANGATQADLDAFNLLDDGQKMGVEWQILQDTGKASYANRPYMFRGSVGRNAAGLLFGLPMWSLGRLEGAFRRLNYQTKGKYVWETIPIAAGLFAYGALMGIAREEIDRKLKKVIYGEESSLPGLSNVRSVSDFAKLATRAWASLFPIVGDAVNATLNTPDRFGNLDSAFVSWNFATDAMKMFARMYQTRDMVTPVESFIKRWSPAAHVIINATTQSGLVKYHNALNEISAATPDTIESRRRGSAGMFAGTPTTPLIQAMKEAAFDNNQQAFSEAYKRAVEEKKAEGIKDPEKAVQASFSAGNPWSVKLGRLPTDAERQLILGRMDPDQRADVLAAETTYQRYGDMIGARVPLTQEDSGSGSGSGSRSSSGLSVGLPVTGPARGLSAGPAGLGGSRLASFSSRLPSFGGAGGASVTGLSTGRLPSIRRSGRSRSRGGSRIARAGRIRSVRAGKVGRISSRIIRHRHA